MTIPERLRRYAEVVVTSDGLAHRPAWTQVQTGTRQCWDSNTERMVDVPIMGLAYRPACIRNEGPGQDLPKITHMSAGWAHSKGHAGCPACYPAAPEE